MESTTHTDCSSGELTERLARLKGAFDRCGDRAAWQRLSASLARCHEELAELRRTSSGAFHPEGREQRARAAREAEPVYEAAADAKHQASERLLKGGSS